jgi:HD superfamily phosphohydrolase
MRPHPFNAVNLISDPIHGYIELTKRLTRAESGAAGLPDEDVAEDDLLDTAWLQRLRRISQLQSARWVFPTAEHSRFTHGLGVMHEAGLWARSLYPSLRSTLAATGAGGAALPSEGLVVETLRVAGLLHDVGHGPFAHFFDDHVLAAFPSPPDPRRVPGKRLTHEDLSQRIIEDELAALIGGLRRAPGAVPERDAFAEGEAVDPAWVSFLISKPALADPAMPRWVRWLQPLLSGVFTVDNLDYVRRDAYLTGVAIGPVDVERLRRYAFVSDRGLTLFEPGLPSLEMFLTTRRYMYQQVYFHRTVRAIDLDLAEVFGPSVEAIFGAGSPAESLSAYADLDEYALLHQAARWARGESVAPSPGPGDGTVTRSVADAWRAILLRRPTWHAEAEVRAEYEPGGRPDALIAALGVDVPGAVTIDLAEVDTRPADPRSTDALLALEGRDGRTRSMADALAPIPAFSLIARRYGRPRSAAAAAAGAGTAGRADATGTAGAAGGAGGAGAAGRAGVTGTAGPAGSAGSGD